MAEVKTHNPFPIEDPVSDTMKLLRDKPPAHYILQIDSFSFLLEILEKSDAKSYDSMTFEACGYKWKLSLYPNGDQKRNGKGFISLYLRIEGTNALPLGWEIHVNCTFFVLDQNQEKYLTIQEPDVCGEFRRFYAPKKETGLNRLMQLDVFKDERNGYLVQDKCVFGVEVSVNSYTGRGECLAMPVKPSSATYTWKIVGSKSNEMRLSEAFTRQDFKWRLKLFPRGTEANKGKYLSLFLQSLDAKTTLSVYAEFKLRVKHQLNGKDIEKKADHLFTSLEGDWGFGAFLSLNDIKDASKGFLVNDTLIFEVEFVRISSVKSFTEGCANL